MTGEDPQKKVRPRENARRAAHPETANVGAGLWKSTGMWAWLLHRISGLVLVGYLFAHIWAISQSQKGAGPFDRLFQQFQQPVFVVLDVALAAAVIYHAFNGIRVLLMDVGIGVRAHKAIFYAAVGGGIACLAVFAVIVLSSLA